MIFSKPTYGSGKRELTQIAFGGYNHTRSASEGELYDMKNLTSADYPVLSVRPPRILVGEGGGGGTLLGYRVYDGYICEVSYSNDNGNVYFSIGEYGTDRHFDFIIAKNDTRDRTFTFMGDYMIIFPDKKYIKLSSLADNPVLCDMEISISSSAVIGNGTYGGIEAMANTVTFPEGAVLPDFSVGDAVTISGCSTPENNKTAIIEEIDGNKLIFLENCFVIPEGESEYTEEKITLSRKIPDLDYLCEHQNRLYGCRGDTVYVSKLGNPLVWYNYEGSAGAWTSDVGSPGDFTACFSYGSYVYFFKEETVYKLYGYRPDNFQLSTSAALGVKEGSAKSLAVASEILFYHSRTGIMAYTGGSPSLISSNFGDIKYKNAVGGSDGVNYYVSLEDEEGKRSLFKFDVLRSIWMKEDDIDAHDIFFDGRMYIATNDRVLYALGDPLEYDVGQEYMFRSFAEFGDFYTSLDKKVMSRLYARFEIDDDAMVDIYIKVDSGKWEKLTSVTGEGKRVVTVPIVPRRCDHYRIKLQGIGTWRLYALSREGYTASKK